MSDPTSDVRVLRRERTESDLSLKKLDEEKAPPVDVLDPSEDGHDDTDSVVIEKAEDVALKVCLLISPVIGC